jgi:chaperonin GroES
VSELTPSPKVDAVCDDVKSLKVGDKILFDKYAGCKIHLDSQKYLIIKEEDVLGILS